MRFPASKISPILVVGCMYALSCVACAASRIVVWGNSTAAVTNIPAGLSNVLAVSAGANFSLALTKSGQVVAWGLNQYGQTNVPIDVTNVIAVSAGAYHSLAVTADGRLNAWGNNSFGQTNVPSTVSNIVSASAGAFHSVALTADGHVFAWGRSFQTNVPSGLSNVVAISAAGYHTLALTAQGSIIWWGDAGYQGGMPSQTSNIVAIAAGGREDSIVYSLALTANARVLNWGHNLTAPPPALTNVHIIAAGYDYDSLAVVSTGVVSWGLNFNGQGNVPSGLSNVTSIAVGYAHSLALVGDIPLRFTDNLLNPRITANNFVATMPTLRGKTYLFERNSRLSQTAWEFVRLAVADGTVQEFTFPIDGASRFYRVRQIP
jgi:hypothetical protein